MLRLLSAYRLVVCLILLRLSMYLSTNFNSMAPWFLAIN
jgi:hypothetical protein